MGDSWRWQLRDSEGQWVRMGSKVKWLSRGKWLHGTVTGSPRPDIATVKPENGGSSLNIDTRRISVESPATPPQPKPDAGVGRPTRVSKPKGVPAAAKTPDPEEQRRQWWLQRTGSPGPTGTPEQIEALSPVDKGLPLTDRLRADENKRRDLLKIAAEAKPGTHVWRGETLSGSPQDAASIGIHWSASPSPVITKAPDMIGVGQTDVIWHGVIEKDTKAIPRAHAMWRGVHRSMDSEAEVRLHPGTHVRLLGVRVDGKYQKVDRVVPIQNLGDLGYEGLDINLPKVDGTMEVAKGATTVTTSARDSLVAKRVARLTIAQKIALKALVELAPKTTRDGVTAADISQHLYGKRTAASAIQTALNDPEILKNFVDIKRLPTPFKGQTRILYSPRRSAKSAAAAGLLDSGKTDVPDPTPDTGITWSSANGVATVDYKGFRLRVSGSGWDIYDADGRHIDEGTTEPMRSRHVVVLPEGMAKDLHLKAREVVQKRADEHAAKRDEKAEVDRRVAETAQESLSAEEITARIDALAPAAKKNPRLANLLMLARGMADAGETEAARDYLARAEVAAGPTPESAKVPAPKTDATMEVAPQPHAIMEAEEVVKVKDAQPETKSPKVQAAEKKALAVKTDTRLAEIYEASLSLKTDQERLAYDIHQSSGSVNTAPKYASKKVWGRSLDEAMTDFQGQTYNRAAWERSVARYQVNEQKLDDLDKEAGELNTVYLDAGTWTRAFLVTNAGGHVHRSMSCSTCRPTTRFYWLPEYSGSDEDQIVDDAGERACTICYSSAPVGVLQKKTKIFSEDEKKQALDRTERAAAKVARDAAKNAKMITNPDGSPLWVTDGYEEQRPRSGRGEQLKTETAARQWYVRNLSQLMIHEVSAPHGYGHLSSPASRQKILEALAAKHSMTVEEVRAELDAKAKAKANQELREFGLPKIA